jgi:hypothetical protein
VALPSLLAKIKPKSNKNATATQAKKETTAVIYPTNHSADSPILVIINIVLCGVAFVCFAELVKGVVIVPM